MAKNIKISYIDDQEEMRDGLREYFKKERPHFDVRFIGDKELFVTSGKLNLKAIEESIMKHCPHAVIADNDLGGNSYDLEIVGVMNKIRNAKKSKILLIGCSAYADASAGMEKKMKEKGFDRFFDNVGSDEHMNAICDHIEKSVK